MANSPTSMLFSLNGKDFMESYAKLESAHKFYRGTIQTMAQWSDATGGGRFTKLISLDFISYLKQAIVNGTYKSGVPYNEVYGKKKFAKDPREWFLYGNVVNNISIVYRGKHAQTVGIVRSIKVPRIGMDGKQYGTIGIAEYAMINEFGGANHPARPIFQPAMRDFIAQHFPPMVKAFEKAMVKAANKEAQRIGKRAATSSGAMGDISSTVSQSSLGSFESINNKDVDRDFSSEIATEGWSADRAMTTKELTKSSSSRISKDVNDEMAKMAKSMGMSVDQLNEFLSNG